MALMAVAEALARVLEHAGPLGIETATLLEAHGRVLADDLKALRSQPSAAVSAMDGYAVRAADAARVPVTLKVIGEVPAGHPFEGSVGPGEAARIFTGGVLPSGFIKMLPWRPRLPSDPSKTGVLLGTFDPILRAIIRKKFSDFTP